MRTTSIGYCWIHFDDSRGLGEGERNQWTITSKMFLLQLLWKTKMTSVSFPPYQFSSKALRGKRPWSLQQRADYHFNVFGNCSEFTIYPFNASPKVQDRNYYKKNYPKGINRCYWKRETSRPFQVMAETTFLHPGSKGILKREAVCRNQPQGRREWHRRAARSTL